MNSKKLELLMRLVKEEITANTLLKDKKGIGKVSIGYLMTGVSCELMELSKYFTTNNPYIIAFKMLIFVVGADGTCKVVAGTSELARRAVNKVVTHSNK